MSKKAIIASIVFVSVAFVLGCDTGSSSSSNDADIVAHSYGRLWERSERPYMFNDDNGGTAAYQVVLALSENRVDEIDEISITKADGGVYSRTRGTDFDDSLLETTYAQAGDILISPRLFSSSHPDSLPLGDYEVEIVIGGDNASYTVPFYANGDPSQNSGNVYSAASDSEPQIMDKLPVTTEVDYDGGNLTVTFESDTDDANSVVVLFEDNDGNITSMLPDSQPDFASDEAYELELELESDHNYETTGVRLYNYVQSGGQNGIEYVAESNLKDISND